MSRLESIEMNIAPRLEKDVCEFYKQITYKPIHLVHLARLELATFGSGGQRSSNWTTSAFKVDINYAILR